MDEKRFQALVAQCKTDEQREKLFHDMLVCYGALADELLKDCNDPVKKARCETARAELGALETFQKKQVERAVAKKKAARKAKSRR